MQFQHIGIAADHAGKGLRKLALAYLASRSVQVTDFGVGDEGPPSVDYPSYAKPLAAAIAAGNLDGGIAICGTGIGMAITANKFPGVRAASVWDEFTARSSREHNNANVICLGERCLPADFAIELLRIWLETPFLGGRHQARLELVRQIEIENFKKR